MSKQDIADRAEKAVDHGDAEEVERVMEWMTDYPDEAAAYILYLETRVIELAGGETA